MWVTEAKRRGFDIDMCNKFVGKNGLVSENANTPQITTESPDGKTPSQELCNNALLASGYGWNNKKPLWVTEAKRRGFDTDMCNKLVGKNNLVGENANTPQITTRS